MKKPIYFSKLDSLRFFAFCLVFWSHAFAESFSKLSDNWLVQIIINRLTLTGDIGVHIFFVLSGFLITYLMLSEERISGKFNLRNFYIRRSLRIWPLYYLVLSVGIFVLPNLTNTFVFDGSLLKNLTFLNNFDSPTKQPANIGMAWSVAIEEQFYFFWPLLFLLFKNKRTLIIACFILFVLSILFKINYPLQRYTHTFSNINYLMTGCIGAILFSKYKVHFQQNRIAHPKALILIVIISIGVLFLPIFNDSLIYLSMLLLPICYLSIILNLVLNNSEKISFFSKMGKYTYGMYLYHSTVIIMVKIIFDLLEADYLNNLLINIVVATIAMILTIVISIISYKYFERHILKFKSKFSLVKTRI